MHPENPTAIIEQNKSAKSAISYFRTENALKEKLM